MRALRICAFIVLLGLCAPHLRAEFCAPPDAMKQQLSGTPSAEALNELGVWFARQNSFACAARAFATSIERDSQQKDLPRVVFEFGAALYYSGDTATTVTALQQAESLGYRNVKLNVLLASALDAQHSTAGAIEEWRKALEFDPEAALELDALSSDLNMASMYQEAVDLLEQPRVRPHRTVNQFMNLAAALVQLGRSEEATTVLEDGWNTYPASAEVARQLATLLTCLHRDAQAAMVLRLAAEEQAGIAN